MKRYILGLLMAFVTLVAATAAPGDVAQAPADTANKAVTTPAPAQGAAQPAPVNQQVAAPNQGVTTTTAAPVAGTTVPAATTPSATASRRDADGGWVGLAIWVAVIGAIFAFLWYKGYLVKIRNYFLETQEELKKCSWPSREELKGSTVVVLVTTFLLGVFTVMVDWVLSNLMAVIT